MKHLVIVGGGMAAGRLLGALAERRVSRRITLISAEPEAPYNRVLLPDLISGACTAELLEMHPSDFYAGQQVEIVRADPVAAIAPDEQSLRLASGTVITFDELVLATGARVPEPNVSGLGLPGVTALRSLADAQKLGDQARRGAGMVVIGGGLLGLEAARAMATAGARVTVIHRGAWLLNRQVDRAGGTLIREVLESLGIRCLLDRSIADISDAGQAKAVRLSCGRQLTADTVLLATGTAPNDELARDAGIEHRDGVLVDAHLRSSRANVFAIGECARVAGEAYAMVEPVFAQASVLASNLGGEPATFSPPPPATRLKVAGLTMFAAGQVSEQPGPDDILIEDPARGVYRRLHLAGQRLRGAVLIGDSTGSRAIQRCLAGGGTTNDPMGLAFGRAEAAA